MNKTKTTPHLNGHRQPTINVLPLKSTRPQLSLWQRITCRHYQKHPIYATTWGPDGEWGQHLIHYECAWCGRKLRNRHRHRPPLILPLLLFLAAVLLAVAYWMMQ